MWFALVALLFGPYERELAGGPASAVGPDGRAPADSGRHSPEHAGHAGVGDQRVYDLFRPGVQVEQRVAVLIHEGQHTKEDLAVVGLVAEGDPACVTDALS